MKKNLKKMISYYKPYRGVFFADMLFAIAASAVALAIPLIARYITSSIIYLEREEAVREILYLGVIMAGLVAISCFCNFTAANYINFFGIFYRRKSVCNNNHGSSYCNSINSFLYFLLCGNIYGSSWFVQQKNWRILQKSSRNRNSLSLPSREEHAAFTN